MSGKLTFHPSSNDSKCRRSWSGLHSFPLLSLIFITAASVWLSVFLMLLKHIVMILYLIQLAYPHIAIEMRMTNKKIIRMFGKGLTIFAKLNLLNLA
jgi:hypothetical protein